MPKEPEQRSYSVDEMMEQLQRGRREASETRDKEVVTRPDGSQVTRVRKRKRRKGQERRKRKVVRRKRYGLYSVLGLVVLLVFGGVSLLMMMARFNSKGFREEIAESVGNTTGAVVRINDFSVNPIKTRLKSVQMTWPGGGMPRSLRLSDIQTRLGISSFLRSRLEGSELYARTGTLRLGPDDGKSGAITSAGSGELLNFGNYRCNQFDLEFETESRRKAFRIRDSELVARAREQAEGMRFTLSGGFLRFGTWSELKVENGLGEWYDGGFHLVSLFTQSEQGGEAVFKGVQPIRRGVRSVFDVELVDFPLEELLGEKALGRLLRARISSSNGALSINPVTEMEAQLEIRFEGKEGAIEGFRFLGGLASILRKEHYSRPEGGSISGVLRLDADQLTIEDLRYEIRSHLVLTGSLIVRNEEMSGALRLGVPEALMMKTLNEPRYASFSLPSQGYCWAEIQLGGSLDQPDDDFLRNLEASPTSSSSFEVPPPSASVASSR